MTPAGRISQQVFFVGMSDTPLGLPGGVDLFTEICSLGSGIVPWCEESRRQPGESGGNRVARCWNRMAVQ